MTAEPLRFVSEAKLTELRQDIVANIGRYVVGDFLDLERDNGWAVESLSVQVDTVALSRLAGTERTADADIENSIIVYDALKGMTPALAREERIWVRLTHIECLSYCRARWLTGLDGELLRKSILVHMFAPGLTGIRDHNALSRLWWNMHISAIADPDDPSGALRLLVKRADIRTSFVERSGTAARRPLARAVVRAMRRNPWLTSSEEAFRAFMKVLNRDGGGVLFEALEASEMDQAMDSYANRAERALG